MGGDSGMKVERGEPVRLGRVGIIALVGFAVGIVWPRLAGVSLVPEAPVEGGKRPAPATRASASAAPAPEAGAEEAAEAEALPGERVHVGEAQITSCESQGKKQSDCGEVDFDALAHPRLMALTACPAATGAFGKLSLGFDLNFETGKVDRITTGQSTDMPSTIAGELLACAKKDFKDVSVAQLKHDHDSYRIFYILEFKAPESGPAGDDGVVAASGRATVRWNAALIRSAPEREAKVRTRLLSGTRVVVTGRKGEWYRVKYDARGREGWVHGAAIGM